MPRLNQRTRDDRRLKLESAALALFLERGFHGVGLRDVCRAAGVSLGNVYNHFDSKEALFRSLVDRLYADFRRPDQPIARFFASPRFPDDLEDFGLAVRDQVRAHRDYLLLVYVDVAELRGRHVARHYAGLTARFRKLLGAHFAGLRAAGRLGPVDPARAFTAVYMQFFNYFIVEQLFSVRRHFGASDAVVVRDLARLFREGLLPRHARKGRTWETASASPPSRRSSSRRRAPASPRSASTRPSRGSSARTRPGSRVTTARSSSAASSRTLTPRSRS